MSLLALWRRVGRARNSNHSNISRVENAVSLHLATTIEETSAWKTAIYKVSAFAKTEKPCILRITINFFQRVYRPSEGTNWIFMKKPVLSFEKLVFEESKLEFWAP